MRNFIDIMEAVLDKKMFTPEIVKKVDGRTQERFEMHKPNMKVLGQIQDRSGKEFQVWGVEDDEESRFYAGTLEDRAVGYIVLRRFSPDFPEMKYVSMVFVTKKFARQGIGGALYRFALDRGIEIVSDAQLSPASKGVWKSLMADPNIIVTMANSERDMHEEPLRNVEQVFRDKDRRLVARLK